MYFIGIDLGTSSVKLLLMEENGLIRKIIGKEYPVFYPRPGWSEQDPEDWWQAVRAGIPELLKGIDASQVRGIGAGGQMHGLVALDEQGSVLRPAILWNDSRTGRQVEYLNETVGRETLSRCTANIAFAGFTAPKLLWMRENEPELFRRIAKILLPKDYINYRLTGVFSTDYSDASGTLLLNVAEKRWSPEMLKVCGLSGRQLPRLYESYAPVGCVKPETAAGLGLPENVTVCAGAGDNAAAAVGCGAVGKGKCNISLGTSGTVFITGGRDFRTDPHNALHSFVHADGGYHLMGCILSAASCNKWWRTDILDSQDFTGEDKRISEQMLGNNGVYFLPYLMGERSPLNDSAARGAFLGMRMDTTRADMTLAVLEGVAFAIRSCVDVVRSDEIPLASCTLCGGGAKNALWRTIFANVLNMKLQLPVTEQGPGYGGAMLAAVACGVYPSVEDCAEKLVRVRSEVHPQPELTARYEKRYAEWRSLYPALKPVFRSLSERG